MDVLIMPTPPPLTPFTGSGDIVVMFTATGRFPNGKVLQFSFGVTYIYGATPAQQRTAILAAAKVSAESAYGQAVPANARVEIFGV